MAVRGCSVSGYGHQQLEAQLHNGSYVDLVVFVSEGGKDTGEGIKAIKAHRMVLACWSPVLKDLIDRAASERHSGWILLQGCRPDAVRDLLRMLYRGQLSLSEANVWEMRRGGCLHRDARACVCWCAGFLVSAQARVCDWVFEPRPNC